MVVAHTDRRMTQLSEQQLSEQLRTRGLDTRSLKFGAITDQAATLQADVQRIRSWPFAPPETPVMGGIYHVSTGMITTVVPSARFEG